MDLILVGLGNVGQGFLQILIDKRDDLLAQWGFAPRIVAAVTGSRGTLHHPDGLSPAGLLAAVQAGSLGQYADVPGLVRDWPALRLVEEVAADVLVEASPTNLQTGQPALDLCRAAFETGKHVVLANKGPVAVAYQALTAHAAAAGKRLLFEGTVMAGTPSLRLAQEALAGCTISAARGILNGTTNYILSQMDGGLPYAEALAQAQALGYAETNPAGDVEGWDAAGKAIILGAALFGAAFTLDTMSVSGITALTPAEITAAHQAGERWKLIASVTPGAASVALARLPLTHPLASISGAMNAITYTTDLLGDVTLIGAGAGRVQTGFALLADLLALHRRV